MRRSAVLCVYILNGLNNDREKVTVDQSPFEGTEHYKKWKPNLFTYTIALVSSVVLEGWSGTTWPLQLRQPGSTPGPFAIVYQDQFIGGGPHGH